MRSKTSKRKLPKRRWGRLVAVSLGALSGAVVALWFAIHRFDWLGPMIANTLRAAIGPDRVAKLEDFVYALEDDVNQVVKRNEAPKTYWSVPPKGTPRAPTARPPAVVEAQPVGALSVVHSALPVPAQPPPGPPPFHPVDPGPVFKRWHAQGDGVWVPILDPRRPDEPPYLYKTLLHPDRTRGWAEVFVVAVDLPRVDVFMMAGRHEPKSENPEAEKYERLARIPEKHHEELLAAFNGGFMTEHGAWGMKIDGIVLVPPKPKGCTLALYKDGSMRIASWKNIADTEQDMLWYRQAPECMYENGKLHPGLTAERQRGWGATLDGETVIRRSAVGLSADRKILYVSITNHTTARVLADGLRHAGAVDIAQMDVNWSYPKFVLFEPKNGGTLRMATALASGFEFSEDEYIRARARRDFFYLVRKPAK